MAEKQEDKNPSVMHKKCRLVLLVILIFTGLFVNNAVSADNCKHFGSGNCVCTEKFVECHGEHWIDNNIVQLFPYIKDYTENITITDSNFTELSKNVFGSCSRTPELVLNQLKYLDLSHNNIHTIHGKTFRCMPHLQTLILAHNEWQLGQTSSGFFTSLPELRYLDLTSAFEEMRNGSKLVEVFSVTELTQLEFLGLALNELMVFGHDVARALCQMPNLKTLDLSDNWLEEPVILVCLTKLETLDLSNNSMLIIPEELRDVIDRLPKLRHVRLDQNRFKCDCDFMQTHRWLRLTSAPVNKDALRCVSGYNSSYINKTVLSLEESDLKCPIPSPPSAKPSINTGLIIGLAFAVIASVIIVLLIIIMYVFGNCKMSNMGGKPVYTSVKEVETVANRWREIM